MIHSPSSAYEPPKFLKDKPSTASNWTPTVPPNRIISLSNEQENPNTIPPPSDDELLKPQQSYATEIQPLTNRKYQKVATNEDHQPHCILQYLENIKLAGDTISNLLPNFMNEFAIFYSNLLCTIDISLPFQIISPYYQFGESLIPDNEYYIRHYKIFSTYS